MTTIRLFKPNEDWPETWAIIEPVFRSGETYGFDTRMSEDEGFRIWITAPEATFVAVDEDGTAVGTYYIKPNHGGPGAHVCNCGYIVAEAVRGRGIASDLCRHSQVEAAARGFRAMQYNLVASTNAGAVRLWKKHGFVIVGTLPGAFRHPTQGFVDAYVMYKLLDTAGDP